MERMKHWEKLRLTAVDSQTPGVRARRQTALCIIDGDATPHGLAQRERWRFRREAGWTPEKRVSVNNDGEEKGEEKHKTVVKIAWDLRKSILALTEYYSSRIRFKYI